MAFRLANFSREDARRALFQGYSGAPEAQPSTGYGYPGPSVTRPPKQTQYNQATPNCLGQYSTATYRSLEAATPTLETSQKFALLKKLGWDMNSEINRSTAEIRERTEAFEEASRRIMRTTKRMLGMAERAGVGLKAWLVFFATVGILFFWGVWR